MNVLLFPYIKYNTIVQYCKDLSYIEYICTFITINKSDISLQYCFIHHFLAYYSKIFK